MTTMKDGIVKRGSTWSYVVRVPDPRTGKTKPSWVGKFPTEKAAKAARDEARSAANKSTYVDRSTVTVADYLREWLVGHSVAVKPKTLSSYRTLAENYVIPYVGGLRIQGVRPATFSRLYRDLLEGGGRGGGPLSATTVGHVHRMLSKALTDAVRVDKF
jgi:integrase